MKGLIPEGTTFIAGPPKLGKSIFALNIAVTTAEGREIVEREGLQPKTAGLDPDLWAASVALGRYDAAHMEWAERSHAKDRNEGEA